MTITEYSKKWGRDSDNSFAVACYDMNNIDELQKPHTPDIADDFDCDEWGISPEEWSDEIIAREYQERFKIKGRDTVDDPKKAARNIVAHIGEEMGIREYFVVIYLSTKNEVINTKVMFEGTIDEAHVHPREIAREALMCNASGIILGHNHPSGGLKASRADHNVTRHISECMKYFDIKVLDHVIVVPGGASMSFSEEGLI